MIATDATDLDRLAEALRNDGVVIDRVMGSGEAQQSHDRIVALIREVSFPVYVALVEKPVDLSGSGHESSEAMAALLHRRIGGAGLYVVGSTDGLPVIVSYGLGADPALLSLSASANSTLVADEVKSRGVPLGLLPPVMLARTHVQEADALVDIASEEGEAGVYPPTLDEDEVRTLADATVEVERRAGWRPEIDRYVPVRTASEGFSVFVGGLVGLVVALLLGQTLRGWPHRALQAPSQRNLSRRPTTSRPSPPSEPVLTRERARAQKLVDALARDLSRGDWSQLDVDLGNAATTARTAAEHLLDSADVADLIGAQVLARTGSRDLVRARKGRGTPYRPCYFDPRHGAAADQVGWRLGQGQVDVPCCGRCEADVAAGREPEILHVQGRGGLQPYWERRDIWATTGFGAVTDSLALDVLRDRQGRG